MNNVENKLHELKQQIDNFDTSDINQRIESNLRSAWQPSSNNRTNITMENEPKKSFNWKIFGFAAGGVGLAVLALITTVVISPTGSVSGKPNTQQLALSESTTTQPLKKDAIKKSTGETTLNFDPSAGDTLGNSALVEDMELGSSAAGFDSYEYKYDKASGFNDYDKVDSYYRDNDEYTYDDKGETKQLFDETVALSIDVKADMLDVMHGLRDEVAGLEGYVINISYYNTSGTINVEVPTDKLSTLEEYLAKIDANHEVAVLNYNVENVSAEVVDIDEQIKQAEEYIATYQTELAAEDLTAEDKENIQDKIDRQNEYIEEQQIERNEVVAEYDLIAVSITVNDYESFWEGNYYQYDRSTFSGLIKYEFGKAVYSLIRSTSKLVTFFVWLAVYSVIFIPAGLIVRAIIRRIRRKMKLQK